MYIPRHQKTYLSREMTRAMGMEMPIGDPHGGPAYGERNDPVSAIISIGTMVGSYAAAGSFAAMTIMQGVAFAGAALSLVGNVTGNSTLSKIGMVAGLAGGIGALAESAGMFSTGTLGETFGIGGGAPAAGAGGAPGPTLNQTPTTYPLADAPSIVADTVTNPMATNASQGLVSNAAPQLNNTPLADVPGSPFQGTTIDFASQQVAPPAAQPAAQPAGAPAAPSAAAPQAPTIPGARPDLMQAAGVTAPGAPSVMTGGGATPPGFFDSLKTGNYMDAAKAAGSGIMDLAKTNPGAAYMLGQAATGVGDYLSGKTAAQIAQMEASGELSKAQADKIRYEIELNEKRRKQLNTNMALPLNFSINPNAVTINQPGLINGARGG